jgi:hypothetical protein
MIYCLTRSLRSLANHRLSRITVLALGLAATLATLSVSPDTAEAQEFKCVGRDAGPKAEKPAGKGEVPRKIDCRLIGGPAGLTKDKISIKEEREKPGPLTMPAEDIKNFLQQTEEKLSLVILIQGDGRWMGNETFTDDDTRSDGAFTGLGPALDSLVKAGPPGSQAAVITYGGGAATPRLAMGDISLLNGGVLGSQKDYDEVVTPALLVGLDAAFAILAQAPGRRVLITIGDGTGEDEDISGGMRERAKKLAEASVEMFSMHYTAQPQDSATGKQNMKTLGGQGAKETGSKESFTANADAFVETLAARYYITFPGGDLKRKPAAAFSWDGNEHELIPILNDEELEPIKVVLGPAYKVPVPEEGGSLWWLWFIVLPLVLIVGVVALLKMRAPQEIQPPPQPVIAAPPPPGPAGPPPGPAKTMMFNLGGSGGDGFPVVGWVVPLNGSNQFQTFKLNQGPTKLGTGGGAHVVVNDGFMSTEHAQILCTPDGFKLMDNGSTNGTLVNDRRISEHELVDNDVFTLGKTNFKFKSTV